MTLLDAISITPCYKNWLMHTRTMTMRLEQIRPTAPFFLTGYDACRSIRQVVKLDRSRFSYETLAKHWKSKLSPACFHFIYIQCLNLVPAIGFQCLYFHRSHPTAALGLDEIKQSYVLCMKSLGRHNVFVSAVLRSSERKRKCCVC